MNFGSVCSGIEAASVAWNPLGWRASFLSEIEKFPSAVLAHHHPHAPNHGDMTRYEEWPDHAIDLLVGGTPCQSFSVAGLRKGLADPRGNLMLTYLAIARRYQPRWLVWENVPGVLSSNGGRDFGTFVRGLEECGYHAAWRVLDAQFVRVDGFGRAVPQRRRRVFVVGYLGDWRRAAAVLLEREGMFGNSAPRRQAGQGPASTIGGGVNFSGQSLSVGDNSDVAPTLDTGAEHHNRGIHVAFDNVARSLTARHDSSPCIDRGMDIVAFSAKDHGGDADFNVSPTLRAGWAVRRLTPTECERLQGFPDGYTAVPYRGKEAADGPRYKALGNSMAVNAMRWIGRRIEAVEAITQEQARAA